MSLAEEVREDVLEIDAIERQVPSLVGQPIYCQSMLAAWPIDLRLSNVVADVITQ